MSYNLKEDAATIFKTIQQSYCAALQTFEPTVKFKAESWERPDSSGGYGGGGVSCVLQRGSVFEQAGVNFSRVQGTLSLEMSEKLTGEKKPMPFFATGTSLVIHPYSPLVPTTHANVRYLEVGPYSWFGGGADLTPYYLFEEDASQFHLEIKKVCDRANHDYYPRFKKWCDEYFYLPHRKETRGVGGIFFDYLGKDAPKELPDIFQFTSDFGKTLPELYTPIVQRRKALPFTPEQKEFQLIRRGRYVEFNLLYDRGTLFGLKTDGRAESILMSLPPVVRWEYNYTPLPSSHESKLIEILQKPREWISG